ncbi:MAG: hypothetical protein WC023_14620 [Rhodocyclaceae bacterium]
MNSKADIPSAPVPITRLTPGRRALLLTLLAFVLPLMIGGYLYISNWRPSKTANHGELILPPKPVPVGTLGSDATGKWLMIVAGDQACEAECIAQLRNLRSIQVSLGREIGRMRRVVLTRHETASLAQLRAEQPDLLLASPTTEWAGAFPQEGPHRVFLVDPAGNLMMQYAPDAEPKGIRADLERLLKYSWIG